MLSLAGRPRSGRRIIAAYGNWAISTPERACNPTSDLNAFAVPNIFRNAAAFFRAEQSQGFMPAIGRMGRLCDCVSIPRRQVDLQSFPDGRSQEIRNL